MVPRTSRAGRGFKGAWEYYAHDKRTPEQKAQGQEVRTRERVGFVQTENLGGIEDDRAAIGLMIDTARQSDRCEKPVYAFSLSWHPEETPSPQQMIFAGREALTVLGMQEHQAVMISHTDTAHPHVHVIVNRVHPETGRAINVYKDYEKLSAWALEYEREQGKVYCQARAFKGLARKRAMEQDGTHPPRYVDNTIAECWTHSGNGKGFQAALEAKGWSLAKGDRKEAVLMAVTPSGRAFAVLRELNKGRRLKGQTIKAKDFDRQTADLRREDLRPVKDVQQEMERRARSRSGEKASPQAHKALREAWEKREAQGRFGGTAKEAFDTARQDESEPFTEEAAGKAERERMQRQQELEAWTKWQRGQLAQRQKEETDAFRRTHRDRRYVQQHAMNQTYLPALSERMRALSAIEARQDRTGLRGWIDRLRHREDREREPVLRREIQELKARHEATLKTLEQKEEAAFEALRARHHLETEEQKQQIDRALQKGRVPEPANQNERETLQKVFEEYSRAQQWQRERQQRDQEERARSGGRGGRSRSLEP